MATKRRRARLWFRLQIRGTQWSVFFGNLAGNDQGVCDYDKAKIVIGWHVAREAVLGILWHEIGHANADASGADRVLRNSLPSSDMDDIAEYEENYMRTLNNCMYETLQSTGFLRLPEIPGWF